MSSINNDSSGSNPEISSTTNSTLEFIGIALFVGIILLVAIYYIRDTILGLHQPQLTAPMPRNDGLHQDDISLLPQFIYQPSKISFRNEKHNQDHKGKALFAECAVCISELEEGDIVRVLPTCKHFFHVKCIDMWLCTHSSCPMCRAHPEPEKVKMGVVSISPPLPQLRRCGTMSERKDSFNLGLCLGSPFMKNLSKGNLPYLYGSSLQGSPCMFTPPRGLLQETRIGVRFLDESEIREITERLP